MRTSALAIIHLELGQPDIIHRSLAAQSVKQRECGAAAPLTSNRQIALELGLNVSDTQAMTEQLRAGLVAKAPAVTLKGQAEIDEVYVVAGHKGQPDEVAKRGDPGGAAGWQERRAAAR